MTSPNGRYERRARAVKRTALWLNPLTGSPSAAFETSALLDSFGPSLMPRTSALQGAAAGFNMLVARSAASMVEWGVTRLRPFDVGLGAQLATRAAVGLAGAGAAAAAHEAPPPPTHRTQPGALAGVPLQQRRTRGPRWRRGLTRRTPQPA